MIHKKDITVVIPCEPNKEVYSRDLLKKQGIKYIIERGKNPSKNRNKGAKKSRTKLVGFINAHSIISEDWIDEIIKFFYKHPGISAVGGPQLNSKNEGFFGRSSGYALSSIFGAAGTRNRYKKMPLNLDADETSITSTNLICKKEVFKSVRFDENLYPGEDPKFVSDLKKERFKVAYSPNLIVYNKRRNNFKSLMKQIFNYGRVRPKKEKTLDTLKRSYFILPSLFVFYLLILPTLLFVNYLFIYPIIIYIILNIIFSIYESLRNNDVSSALIIPAIFFAIHISYGVGFLYGLIERINL